MSPPATPVRSIDSALAMRRKFLGNDHTAVASSIYSLAVVILGRGNLPEAEAMLRECLETSRKLPPNDYVELERVYYELVKVLTAQGKMSEARAFFEEAKPFRKDSK